MAPNCSCQAPSSHLNLAEPVTEPLPSVAVRTWPLAPPATGPLQSLAPTLQSRAPPEQPRLALPHLGESAPPPEPSQRQWWVAPVSLNAAPLSVPASQPSTTLLSHFPTTAVDANAALTARSAVRVSRQSADASDAQAPPQASNRWPSAALALKATFVPSATVSAQSLPQSITVAAPTLPTTLPWAGAATVRVRAAANRAPTARSAFSVSAQSAVPEQAPVQPVNRCPASAMADRVTRVPFARAAEQSVRLPEPQSMTVLWASPPPTVPVTRPFDGAATDSLGSASTMRTAVPLTVMGAPSLAVPDTTTVSGPSRTESADGVSVNDPSALRAPPGMPILKSLTAAKSSSTVAVPPATDTVTVLAALPTAVPVSVAVTVTCAAPPSSGTLAGDAERTACGRHSTSIHPVASPARPSRLWVARNPNVRGPGAEEETARVTLTPSVSVIPSSSTVTAPPPPRSSQAPWSVPPPAAPARPLSVTATAALPSAISGLRASAVRDAAGSVLPWADADHPPVPSSLTARTRTSWAVPGARPPRVADVPVPATCASVQSVPPDTRWCRS